MTKSYPLSLENKYQARYPCSKNKSRKINNNRKIRIIITILIWLDRQQYKLSFNICYDIVWIRAREQCNVAQMTLCLLLSILNIPRMI